jgi:hypothetical protein
MKETTEKTSWINRILGGKLSSKEKGFSWFLISLLLFWPLLVFLSIFAFDQPTLPLFGEIARYGFAFIVFGYPLYLLPLIIIASRISKKLVKPYLFYLISGLPLIALLLFVLIAISPLAENRPEGSDFFSYREIGTDYQGSYALDKKHVYYCFEKIEGADVATFHLIGENTGYSADKNHVYYTGKMMKGVTPKTFKMSKGDKACDGKDYYIYGIPFHVSDYKSFRPGYNNWSVDKNYIYYTDDQTDDNGIHPIPVGDYKSFKGLNEQYAKDICHVYFKTKIVEGADPATFHTLAQDNNIGQDRNCLYYKDKATEVKDYNKLKVAKENSNFYVDGKNVYTNEFLKMPEGTNVKHLTITEYRDWSKDQKRVYWKNRIVEGADPKTFVALQSLYLYEGSAADNNQDNDYGKDAHHIFHRDAMLKGADYATFVCGWDGQAGVAFAFDKHRYYEGHPTPLISEYRKGRIKVEHE